MDHSTESNSQRPEAVDEITWAAFVERLARDAGFIEMDHDCIEGVPLEKLPAFAALIARYCARIEPPKIAPGYPSDLPLVIE